MMAGDLLQRYAWASDSQDREALASCFAPDGRLLISDGGAQTRCVATGGAAIAQWVYDRHAAEFAAGHRRRHMTTMPVLSSAPGHIASRSYFSVLVGDQAGPRVAAMGWYDDEMVCQQGLWTFQSRTVHVEARGEQAPFTHFNPGDKP